MTNQRVSRGMHAAEASRILPIKRGEQPCPVTHETREIESGVRCPVCGAVK